MGFFHSIGTGTSGSLGLSARAMFFDSFDKCLLFILSDYIVQKKHSKVKQDFVEEKNKKNELEAEEIVPFKKKVCDILVTFFLCFSLTVSVQTRKMGKKNKKKGRVSGCFCTIVHFRWRISL